MSIFRLPPVLINIELGTLTPSKITSCFKTSKRVTKQKHKKKKKGTVIKIFYHLNAQYINTSFIVDTSG